MDVFEFGGNRGAAVGELLQGIARVVEPDAAGSNIRLVCDCPTDLPPVHGDPEPLRQALFNLALNACQSMPNGGTLRLSAQPGVERMADTQLQV